MPRGVAAWPTAEALWITAVGWARAAEDRFGEAWVATPEGAWRPDELPWGRDDAHRSSNLRRSAIGRLPIPPAIRTLLKDLRLWSRQSGFRVSGNSPWDPSRVRLVWEHHDLFNRAGRQLAAATGAPLVRYVHAPQVWEAAKWGVQRPLWGRWLAAREVRAAAAADLVACVSSAVRDELVDMGVAADRVVVAPMAVDTERFSPQGGDRRAALGIHHAAVVVGWCGSFRPFHGLDTLLAAFGDAAAGLPQLHLLLVGDGAMRPRLQAAAEEAGIGERVTFAGRVAHSDMPAHLRAMDLTVVSSDGGAGFHYSPLKLREYAACGRAVVAPDEGELGELGAHGFVRLHRPGSRGELAAALAQLAVDRGLRTEMGRRARDHARQRWSWRAQLDSVMARLGNLPAAESGGPA